jgi:hypothetical protein
MEKLWLLRGNYEAPGWKDLERDAKADVTDVVLFDRLGWALVNAAEAPDQYEGMQVSEPPDGLYLDPNGVPMYLVNRQEVASAKEVIEALGAEAAEMLEKTGDAHTALERLGKVY